MPLRTHTGRSTTPPDFSRFGFLGGIRFCWTARVSRSYLRATNDRNLSEALPPVDEVLSVYRRVKSDVVGGIRMLQTTDEEYRLIFVSR
jgi:hypothetical protein